MSRITPNSALSAAPRLDFNNPQHLRRVLVALCVICFVNQLAFGATIPVLPLHAKSFGVSATAIGMSIAVFGIARFAVALPSGLMADRFGRRPIFALGGIVSALGNIGCAWASSYHEFLMARFVAGAGASIVLTIGAIMLADIAPPDKRGRVMSIYQGVFLFAVGIGPFPGGLMAEQWGLRSPFVFYGLASLLVAILAWWWLDETWSKTTAVTDQLPSAAQSSTQGHNTWRMLYSNPGFVLASLVSFVSTFTRTGAVFAIVPLMVTSEKGLNASVIGAGFALSSIFGLLASYPAGVISDRYSRKLVIVPTTILVGLSFFLFDWTTSYYGFFIAICLWGTASAACGATPSAYVSDITPKSMTATAMSNSRMLADLGYILGPILLGLIVDLNRNSNPSGSPYSVALWVAGGLNLAIAMAFALGAASPTQHRSA